MWFHLSKSNTDLNHGLKELRCPRVEYLDADITQRVFSIAPTVWQCLISLSSIKVETHYIYEIYVNNPTPARDVNQNVIDANITDEHRITPEVFEANGGFIKTQFIGTLRVNKEEFLQIKSAGMTRNVRPDSNHEQLVFWQVDAYGQWALRNGGADIEKEWNSLTFQRETS
jgi:hypothetical protein